MLLNKLLSKPFITRTITTTNIKILNTIVVVNSRQHNYIHTTNITNNTTNNTNSFIIIKSLCNVNQNILKQKINLMNRLIMKYGIMDAYDAYQNNQNNNITNSSIGQHYRHSLDHIDCCTKVINNIINDTIVNQQSNELLHNNNNDTNNISVLSKDYIIDYDTRIRGNLDESDWNIASERIINIYNLLDDIINNTNKLQKEQQSLQQQSTFYNYNLYTKFMIGNIIDPSVTTTPTAATSVDANIMIEKYSKDQEQQLLNEIEIEKIEYPLLKSTIERELSFIIHHAIHHLAMVRIIVTSSSSSSSNSSLLSSSDTSIPVQQPPLLANHEISKDFGKAPSTVFFEEKTQKS